MNVSVQHSNNRRHAGGIRWLVLLCAGGLAGCSSLGYYGQAISGHLDLLERREPIVELIEDPATPAALREKLQTALEIRRYASRELGLPNHGSYHSYANLEREYVVWNVVATPPLSLEPREWCFLLVGCLQYRGYYQLADARAFARERLAAGDDVFVGGATAYSTLGWFDDPLLNTMLGDGVGHLAQVMFHELAHQRLFIKNDTEFNEAFADSVGISGARRWLAATGRSAAARAFEQRLKLENRLVDLIMATRETLAAVYASTAPDTKQLVAKQAVLAELRREYQQLRATVWRDETRLDAWFDSDLNNAKLAAVTTYRALVPDFLRLLERLDGDFERFYATVAELADCQPPARRRWLARLQPLANCHPGLAKPLASR